MSKPTPKRETSKTHIGPYHEQEPFLWDDKRYHGFVSGVGSGKTHIGIARVAKNVEQWNPGEMGAIVAPASRMIKDTILPLMREYGLIGEGGAWEYQSSYAEEPGIHAPNGARVLILSADNSRTIERLKGLNLAWWWIDERAEVPTRAQRILEQRLRIGEYRNGFITTTPKGKDSVYDFFVGDVDASTREYGEGTLYESADRRAIVGVPTSANPFTPQDYKDSMDDLPDAIKAQEVEGEFVEIGSGVFTKDMLTFVQANELPPRDLNYIASVDVGVETDSARAEDNDTDYWAVTLGGVDPLEPHLYVIDTLRERGMTLKQGVEWIQSIMRTLPQSTQVYVESVQAQRWLRDELSDKGINAVPVNPTGKKEDRLIQLSIPIERGTVKFVNRPPDDDSEREEWMDYYRRNGYAPRWEHLIQEFLAFPDGTHDDAIDSLEILVDNANLGSETAIFGGDAYGRDSE